jgi:hypothetical protein
MKNCFELNEVEIFQFVVLGGSTKPVKFEKNRCKVDIAIDRVMYRVLSIAARVRMCTYFKSCWSEYKLLRKECESFPMLRVLPGRMLCGLKIYFLELLKQ